MDKFTMSFTENLLDRNIIQDNDLVKINYAISVVKSEFVKTLFLVLIFYLMGLLQPFLLLMILVVPLRMSTGGIHVDSSFGCFGLSLMFNLSELIFLPGLRIGAAAYQGILFSSAALICILPLAPSRKRAIKTKEKYRRNKYVSCLLCIFWVLMFQFLIKDTYLIHCGIWAFFMQAIQILIVNVHSKFKRGIRYD